MLIKAGPKQFYDRLLEKFEPKAAICIVKDTEESWPEVGLVGHQNFSDAGHKSLAPHDAMRVDHDDQGQLIAHGESHRVRKLEGAGKGLALLVERLLPDFVVFFLLKGILLEESSEHPEKWPPYQIALVVNRLGQHLNLLIIA